MNQIKSMGIVLSFSIKAIGISAWSLTKKERKKNKEKQIRL